MVSGTLSIKKGYYYAVLSWIDVNGDRHRKWISTGLTQKGNKRRAEEKLAKIRSTFEPPVVVQELSSDMLFSDYLEQWLDIVKVRVKITTFSSYQDMVQNTIGPYFKKKGISLRNLEARHIQQFYSEKLKTVSANSVIHYHAVIFQALKYAMKTDMVPQNVAMKVDRPRKNAFQPTFLDAEEMQQLFEVVRGTRLELPVLVAAFYGLRRGEVLGLKWDAIDFERGTMTIKRTVTETKLDGKYQIIEQDSAKTKSSLRTLPLVGAFKAYFQEVKKAQELNRKVCGNCYSSKYDGYVFVDELGERMKPDYLTSYFPQYIQKHGMRKMRFHDLRHSCASLLLANGVPLKQIQEWLGHSDFSTTANIYAHLDYSSKISSAQAMESGMILPGSNDFESKWDGIWDDVVLDVAFIAAEGAGAKVCLAVYLDPVFKILLDRLLRVGGLDRLKSGIDELRPHFRFVVKCFALCIPALNNVIDELAAEGKRVIFTMGKGGVGKTTVAAAVALGLAKRGKKVHLTTTDPAAHLKFVLDETSGVSMNHIDEAEELKKYQSEVLTKARASGMSDEDIAYVEEDLRSPCTQEIAVFRAFAEIVERADDQVVVIDTAPTGHTLLLLESTQSYNHEIERTKGEIPESVKRLLPRLKSDETEVLIVTLPEATPVYEALRLEDDLQRADIATKWWIVNQSLYGTSTTNPMLAAKAASEVEWLNRINEHAGVNFALIAWSAGEIKGDSLLAL